MRTRIGPRRDGYGGARGRFYNFYIQRPLLAVVIGRLVWGFDARALHRSLATLPTLTRGKIVVDVACGGGLPLRWINGAAGPRVYVGVDHSPAMLERARDGARARGLASTWFGLSDAQHLAMRDEAADVLLMYNALHCFSEPGAAVREAARCVRPDGVVVGSMLIRGATRRADRIIALASRPPDAWMGPGGTPESLRRWLHDAGLVDPSVTVAGALAVFSARRPAVGLGWGPADPQGRISSM